MKVGVCACLLDTMAAWKNWVPTSSSAGLHAAAAANRPPPPITHASMCDAETRYQLRLWVEAKRNKDYEGADAIRDQLKAQRPPVWPDKILSHETHAEWGPLIMTAEKPLPVQEMVYQQNGERKRPMLPTIPYDSMAEETKKQVADWMQYKQLKLFREADGVRELLRRKGVEPETVMIETNWLKRAKTSIPEGPEDSVPKVIRLPLHLGSNLVNQGFVEPLVAMDYNKHHEVFQEASWILGEFFLDEYMSQICQFHYDPTGSQFPEVYEAWKAAGQSPDSMLTIVTCAKYGKAAVGTGGKKFGERSAKLALAVSLAGTHHKTENAKKI